MVEILKDQEASTRLEKLQMLAKEAGASVTGMERGRVITDSSGRTTSEEMSRNAITETEMVQNIQAALQTETMIDMVRPQVETSGLQLPRRLSHYLQWWQLGRLRLRHGHGEHAYRHSCESRNPLEFTTKVDSCIRGQDEDRW